MVRTHPCKPTPTLRSPLCFLFSNDLLGTGLNVTMPVEADNLALADTLASPSYPPDVCFLPAWSSGLVSSPVRPRTVARYKRRRRKENNRWHLSKTHSLVPVPHSVLLSLSWGSILPAVALPYLSIWEGKSVLASGQSPIH